MSKSKVDELAEFCGLTSQVEYLLLDDSVGDDYATYHKDGEYVCCMIDWNPAKDPRQWAMVLEALVEKRPRLVIVSCNFFGCPQFGIFLDIDEQEEGIYKNLLADVHGKTIGQAICDAATQVIESEVHDG